MTLVALLAIPIVWLHDEARATELARRTGKPLLIEFRAPWCGACKLLDERTWSDPSVQKEVAARFVPLEIDFDEHGERAERAHVRELPTILARGKRRTGFVPPARMLRFLRSIRR